MKLFAVCAPGLEPYLAQEMEEQGLQVKLADDYGGVAFDGELDDLYRANLWLRTASRVFAQVGMDFMAERFVRLQAQAAKLPWERFLAPGVAVNIRVQSQDSRLSMARDIAQHVAAGIGERLGTEAPLSKDLNAQVVMVRLVGDRCTIRIDSSGENLYKRGYKLAVAKAPLRETLAAGMVFASGWDRRSTLLDPFCGSGTIAIEAALLGLGIAPGRLRRFQFQDWPGYDDSTWQGLLQEAESQRGAAIAKIYASDRDAGAIEMARANAERAGVAEAIQFSHLAVSSIYAPRGMGWVVTNPPYGERIKGGKDLRNLYARFGDVLREQCPDWGVATLFNDEAMLRQTRLSFTKRIELDNGGIAVNLACGKVR